MNLSARKTALAALVAAASLSMPAAASEKGYYRQVYYDLDPDNMTATATYMTLAPGEVNYPSGTGTFYIGAPVEWEDKSYTVYEVGEYAFLNSGRPSNIRFDGETLRRIGKSAFRNSSVRTFRFGNVPVEEICDSAFYHTNALYSLSLPAALRSIGAAAFMDIPEFDVRSLSLGNALETIGDYAFANAGEELQSVSLGENVKTIGQYAFKGCPAIAKIASLAATPPSIPDNTFDEAVYATATLTVRSEAVEAYKAAPGWKNFAKIAGVSPARFYAEPFYYTLDTEAKTATIIPDDSYKSLTEASMRSSVEYFGEDYDVTAIAPEAFMGCDKLTEFSGSWSLKTLGERAFKGCTNLMEVSISGISDYPGECFAGCTSLSTVGMNVTSIGKDAFKDCVSLTSLTTTSQLQEIGEGAFEGCTAMAELVLNDPLAAIASRAFAGCTAIGNIKIFCTALPTLAADAFPQEVYDNATALFSIELKDAFEASAWSNFKNITTYDFNHTQIDDLYYILDSNGKTATVTFDTLGADNYRGLDEVVIPSSVEYENVTYKTAGIAARAFEGCTSLVYVQYRGAAYQATVGDNAFAGCSALTEFTDTSGNVVAFGKSAFAGCTSLGAFVMPDYLKEIGDSCFAGCTGLENIAFPAKISRIGASAFEGCSKMTIAVLPAGITAVEAASFKGCTSLTAIEIPAPVTQIDAEAFAGCDTVRSIYLHSADAPAVESSSFSAKACGTANVYVPESSVSAYKASSWKMFANILPGNIARIQIGDLCYILNILDSSATLTYKEAGVTNYEGMTEISIPETVGFDSREFTVTAIGGGALSNCQALVSISVPATVKTIKDSAIRRNPELTAISLSEGLEVIEGFSIDYNPKLVDITLPSTLTALGDYAFNDNKALVGMTIPDMVEKVGEEVFYGCSSLKKITLGKSVNYLGYCCLRGCDALEEIRVEAIMPPRLGNSVFNNSAYESVNVYVPEEALQQYIDDKGWSQFLHINPTTGIDAAESDSISVGTGKGSIRLDMPCGCTAEVYDLSGKAVYTGSAAEVAVAPGLYIVKAGSIIRKVIVY